jgi:hypothetical protein
VNELRMSLLAAVFAALLAPAIQSFDAQRGTEGTLFPGDLDSSDIMSPSTTSGLISR